VKSYTCKIKFFKNKFHGLSFQKVVTAIENGCFGRKIAHEYSVAAIICQVAFLALDLLTHSISLDRELIEKLFK